MNFPHAFGAPLPPVGLVPARRAPPAILVVARVPPQVVHVLHVVQAVRQAPPIVPVNPPGKTSGSAALKVVSGGVNTKQCRNGKWCWFYLNGNQCREGSYAHHL